MDTKSPKDALMNGMQNGTNSLPDPKEDADDNASAKDSDFDDCSDPEIRAELALYAKNKENGFVDPNALPLRQKLRLLKRMIRNVDDPNRQQNGVVQVPRSQKNQRRTRAAKGRGLAKKGGNGGKWTWGQKAVFEEEPESLDPNDPNYDSDTARNIRYETSTPELGEAMMEKYVEPIILEFFQNDDLDEAIDSIDELRLSKNARPRVIRLAITLAMDSRKASAREMTSQLISELSARHVLSLVDIERGFVALLNTDLPDLILDYPNAPEIVGNFLARAAADEALPQEFLSPNVPNVDKESWSNLKAKAAMDQAEVMMTNRYRLDTIWGVGGATRPVRFLVTKIKLLLDEYLSSGDSKEAAKCLQELEVPHFHHELIFQAGVTTIEAMHERTARMLATLLSDLCAQSILSLDAIRTGFQRLFDHLPDLCLDVPPAYTLLERWMVACTKVDKQFLPEDIIRKMPQKGRKRFVSEGDGGRLKVVDVPHPYL